MDYRTLYRLCDCVVLGTAMGCLETRFRLLKPQYVIGTPFRNSLNIESLSRVAVVLAASPEIIEFLDRFGGDLGCEDARRKISWIIYEEVLWRICKNSEFKSIAFWEVLFDNILNNVIKRFHIGGFI